MSDPLNIFFSMGCCRTLHWNTHKWGLDWHLNSNQVFIPLLSWMMHIDSWSPFSTLSYVCTPHAPIWLLYYCDRYCTYTCLRPPLPRHLRVGTSWLTWPARCSQVGGGWRPPGTSDRLTPCRLIVPRTPENHSIGGGATALAAGPKRLTEVHRPHVMICRKEATTPACPAYMPQVNDS